MTCGICRVVITEWMAWTWIDLHGTFSRACVGCVHHRARMAWEAGQRKRQSGVGVPKEPWDEEEDA